MLEKSDIASILVATVFAGAGVVMLRPCLAVRGRRRAPPELMAFTLFACAATLFDFGRPVLAVLGWRTNLMPYGGWMPSMFYMFAIPGCAALLSSGTRRSRLGLVGMMGIAVLFGLYEWWADAGEPDFGNPYLIVSPYRPIWTVLVPLFWMGVLLSPRIKQYCSHTSTAQEARAC